MLNKGMTPEDILELILGQFGLEILDKMPIQFTCNCTKSRVEKALISIGGKELQEMIDEARASKSTASSATSTMNLVWMS